MREIKFRQWYNDTMLYMDGMETEFSWEGGRGSFVDFLHGKDNLMQFTGLKDKNGVEIYEGDVIKSIKGVYAIYWKNSSCSFACRKLDETRGVYHLNKARALKAEVIGNIHQSPDLL